MGQKLLNFDFSQGSQNWTKRTDTAAVYAMTEKQGGQPGTVSLTVGPDSPEKDRGAVYYNRTDLPKTEGFYRLTFEAKSALTAGRAGLSLISFGPESKILEHGVSGRRGLSPIRGTTDWATYECIFQVPAGTVMTVLQLELLEGQGTVSFRNAKLEGLDAAQGAELFRAQGRKLVIEPFKQMPERKPKFPLKTQRMIYTAADVARARENIAKYPQAQKVLKEVTDKADKWLNWKDEDLLRLMPDARVPRAFDMNPTGCPVHGVEVFKKDMYPWILDSSHPFQVKCPVGGELYPSNDYETYYKSGFKEKKGWDTDHVDDGWGWVAPNGERYWFVAYANHWQWYNEIMPAIRALSRAYLLTGDKRYAHKTAIMLYRLAEVYPSMDHAVQSRYGMIARDDGYVYGGKIVNHIWESLFFADNYAEAYDNIWDSLDGDIELQKAHGKSGEQIRAFIEANVLEEAADAYTTFKIDGNFGMHQQSLMLIMLAREKMDNKALFHMLVDEPGSDLTHTGLRYALYNQIYRDGMPHESPGYNTHWLDTFASMGELLKKGGYNLFDDQRMKALFDYPFGLVVAGRFTPDWGDSGNVMADLQGLRPDAYRVAYDAYKDPRYLPWLALWGQTGGGSYASFESLFRDPVPQTKALADRRVVTPQHSRVMAGWGMGFLNNVKDNNAIALTYGPHGGHFHWDYLNFDIFANGQKMMPDIGYPDAMNERVQELYTWGTNTVAHNTVVVDAGMQKENNAGSLNSFGDSPFARSIDASAAVYPQTREYRRSMVMVDVDDTNSYAVDFFRVNGGKQHDYSLHGPPGEVSTEDGIWSEKKPGTLAGPNVKLGEIYDNAEMGAEGYPGTFSSYQGSGFQWLYNVQELEKGKGSILFKHMQDTKSQLRVQILPTGDQQVFMAYAWDRPRAKNHLLKYVIVRRKASGAEPLKSTFVSVIEPYTTNTYIQSSQVLAVNEGKVVSVTASAVEIKRAAATDIILSDTTNRAKTVAAYGIETDAESAVVTLDAKGALQRVFLSNGSYLRCKGQSFKAQGMDGTVIAIDPKNQKVTVQLKDNLPAELPSVLERMAFFTNQFRTAVHPLQAVSAKGKVAEFTLRDSLLVGKARLREVGDKIVSSDTIMPFADIYQGVTMLKDDLRPTALVEKVKSGKFTLAAAPKIKLAAGEDIWLSNLGIGDKFQVKPVFSWQAPAK